MKRIKLTQNKFANVSDKDYKEMNKYKWFAMKHLNTFYAVRNLSLKNGKQTLILMHREILQTPKGLDTDHKDNNGLNNQRSNLRIATRAENIRNSPKHKDNVSGFKGVYAIKNSKKWKAQIMVNKKMMYIGSFHSKEEAYNEYMKFCLKYHKSFAHN